MMGSTWLVLLGIIFIFIGLIQTNKTSAKWLREIQAKNLGVKQDPKLLTKSIADQRKYWIIFIIVGIVVVVLGASSLLFNSHS